MCLYRRHGGLDVDRGKKFRLSFLEKWCWRLKNGRERFMDINMVNNSGILAGGSKVLVWCKSILFIRSGNFNVISF